MNFKDKVVVITGGNSGIGKAIAEKFDQQGAKIVIFGRQKGTLEKSLKEFKQAIAIQGDIRKLSDIERLFEETKKNFGKVDVLIANAGIAARRDVQEVDEAFFDEIVDINYKGLYFTVQRSIPYLNPGASVVLISSIAAHVGIASHSVYSSTKAAVSRLARNFSADLIGKGIRVNALSPGFTDTPIFDPLKKSNPQEIKKYTQTIPMKRFAEASEVADAAVFLSSPQASYIVGVDLIIDGGVTAIRQ
jgi:NAD(P)-dependent dehydrogenase (short-subunit alcohol dehydrogenase family)